MHRIYKSENQGLRRKLIEKGEKYANVVMELRNFQMIQKSNASSQTNKILEIPPVQNIIEKVEFPAFVELNVILPVVHFVGNQLMEFVFNMNQNLSVGRVQKNILVK